jgi:hypothetical protein
MKSNEQRIEALRLCGVPITTTTTTLLKEGQNELRAEIQSGNYKTHAYHIYPRTYASANKSQKVFEVFAKELVLAGESVFFIPLNALIARLSHQDEAFGLGPLPECDHLLIGDFYEAGCSKCPYSEDQVREVVWFLRSWRNDGRKVSFQSESPLAACNWWPATLLQTIAESVVAYEIS